MIKITKRIHDPMVVMTRLKRLRKERGLTQKQVAEAIHFSTSTIKQYECGYRIPDEENLNTIASFYNVCPEYILGKTDFKNRIDELTYRWNEKIDIDKLKRELLFIGHAEALGFFHQCSEDPEKDYKEYITYNQMYKERKENMKTRKDITVITGSDENRIIDNFETGEIIIQAVTEEDVERGFQELIKRGIIAE